jgi:hypothetical protein
MQGERKLYRAVFEEGDKVRLILKRFSAGVPYPYNSYFLFSKPV